MSTHLHSKSPSRHQLTSTQPVSYDTVLVDIVGEPSSAFVDTQVTPRRGHTRGVWARGTVDGVLVSLSLSKLLHGTNAVALKLEEVYDALVLLAALVGVPLDAVLRAPVYRLDVASNLVVARRPSEYLPALIYLPRATRTPYSPTSIAFVNRSRVLALYDKGVEVEAHGGTTPGLTSHVLRYELRILRKVAKAFGEPLVAADLATPAVYARAVALWTEWFGKIHMATPPALGTWATVPDLRLALSRQRVADVGPAEVITHIDALHADGLVTTDQRGRLRRDVLRLAAHAGEPGGDDLASELRAAVIEAARLSNPDSTDAP